MASGQRVLPLRLDSLCLDGRGGWKILKVCISEGQSPRRSVEASELSLVRQFWQDDTTNPRKLLYSDDRRENNPWPYSFTDKFYTEYECPWFIYYYFLFSLLTSEKWSPKALFQPKKINNTQLLIPSAPPAFSPKSSDFCSRTKERYEVQSWLRVREEKRGQTGGTEMVMRQNSCLLWLWQERPLGNRGVYSRERQSGEVASAQGLSF